MKLNIDLADKGPGPALAETPSKEKFYPSLHFTHDAPIEIPEEGVMKIRFKKVSSAERKRNDKTEYDCTIEVHELISAEGDKSEKSDNDDAPTKRYTDAEDALDKLASEKSKSKKKNSDDEGY